MKKKDTPLGTSDFGKIIRENRYFVDKSMLVRHVLKSQDVILLCRPRRFGKTLNLDMMRHFFDCTADNRALFEGLAVSRDAGAMEHLGKYPVVWLSLKGAKQRSWEEVSKRLRLVLLDAWKDHRYLAQNPEIGQEYNRTVALLEDEKSDLFRVAVSLRQLTGLLHYHHNALAVILIDEYDTPIHNGWMYGYYDEIVDFMKEMLGGAMKDNKHLKKGVLTGILRVAKESLFSDINNFIASTVLDSDVFSDQFGFTEEEVLKMFGHYDMNGREIDSLHEWYDGYRIGRHRIYNPWSVLNYVFSLEHQLRPYWANTSQDALLRRLFFGEKTGVRQHFDRLLAGEKLEAQLNNFLVFKDLLVNPSAVWTMLALSGYLKAENWRSGDVYDVSIPNKEIRWAYSESIASWQQTDMEASSRLNMLEALADGRVKDFEKHLTSFVERVFSYFDASADYAENFYHAFFLGLLAGLEHRYTLRSNREEGYGRYDICLIPRAPGGRGIVIEIKAPLEKRATLNSALRAAVEQLRLNKYDTGLHEAGAGTVVRLAIAVQGKRVLLQEVK